MKILSVVLSSLTLFTASIALSQTMVSLEDGTAIAVSQNANAVFSSGSAIVTPPGGGVAGLIYTRAVDSNWMVQGSVSIPESDELFSPGRVLDISDEFAVVGIQSRRNFIGNAYVCSIDDSGQWSLDAVLDGSSRPSDLFGRSVAISGDTIAIGSNPGGESGQSGRVSLYTLGNAGWTLEQSIDSTGNSNPDGFGDSIQLSGNYLVVPHTLRGVSNTDIYHRTSDGWRLQRVISGTKFALDQDTLVAEDSGVLRTYILDATGGWREASSIEFAGSTIKTLAVAGELLAVSLDGDTNVLLYQKAEDDSWQFALWIDGIPSVSTGSDAVYLIINGISNQAVMITRFARGEDASYILDASQFVNVQSSDADNIE